jgi:pimeloyl-ACP methyl ester carboxylesterase
MLELWSKPPELADVGSARIAWRSVGRGEPLLLIHGWPLSSSSFGRILPRLAERFTCWLPDTPGLGETEWHEGTDFRFAAQAETLRRFVVDSLGLASYSILASDTGGTIARQLALVDPRRVSRLVLLNTEIPGHRPPFIPLFQRTLGLPGSRLAMRALLRSRALRRSPLGFGGCFVDLDLLDGEFHGRVVAPLLASPRRLEGARRYLAGIDWTPRRRPRPAPRRDRGAGPLRVGRGRSDLPDRARPRDADPAPTLPGARPDPARAPPRPRGAARRGGRRGAPLPAGVTPWLAPDAPRVPRSGPPS